MIEKPMIFLALAMSRDRGVDHYAKYEPFTFKTRVYDGIKKIKNNKKKKRKK